MFGIDPLSPWLVAYVIVVITFCGWVQGALGMGFPMIATPLIAAVSGMQFAVYTIVLPCIACVIVSIFKSPGFLEVLRRFWWMPFCALAGAAAGARLFVLFPDFPYALLLAGVILFYLNMNRLGRMEWPLLRRHESVSGILFGTTAGIFESTANIAAAPLIIYYLGIGLPPLMLVPAMNISFFVGKSTQFVTLAGSGVATTGDWLLTLPLAAIATIACLFGTRVRSRIEGATYRVWMNCMLLAMAMVLLAQVAYRHWFV